MNDRDGSEIRYSIFDPCGNVTALVETLTDTCERTSVAAAIMKRHPDVEQVGFVRFLPAADSNDCQIDLQMAGGEFCGNASMCAAGLYLLSDPTADDSMFLKLSVSGALQPVSVQVCKTGVDTFSASILMPPAKSIEEQEFSMDDISVKLPLVRMEGISHVIVEPDSPLFALKDLPEQAEQAVRTWCGMLSAECLGLMFLEQYSSGAFLKPLVYVPACRTVFWERSCASGTAAVGMYLADKAGLPLDLTLTEPGGSLRVEVSPDHRTIRLYETIRCTGRNLTLH